MSAPKLDPWWRTILEEIAKRRALAPTDPLGAGCIVASGRTDLADRWHVWLNCKTADAMIRHGWLVVAWPGDADDGASLDLTDKARAEFQASA